MRNRGCVRRRGYAGCKRSVPPDTALRLARVLGMPADFWLGLQLDWDLWHAMRSDEASEIGRLVLILSMRRRQQRASGP